MSASDGHVIDLEWGAGMVPFDRCAKCGKPIRDNIYTPGQLVTMESGNAECYGKRP